MNGLPTAQQVAELLQANRLSSAQLNEESLRLGSAQQATRAGSGWLGSGWLRLLELLQH